MTSGDADVTLARKQYAARDERPAAGEIMTRDVAWDITPGFVRGGVYNGLERVTSDFLAPLFQVFARMSPQAETFHEAGEDHVVVLGNYHVRTGSGETTAVRFVHVWTIRDGKLAHLHHLADTALLEEALED